MTEVLTAPAHPTSPAPHSSLSSDNPSTPQPRQPPERVTSYAQNRMSQYSRSSQRSRPQSTALEYPAFNSSLTYALVRDFAYPVFHPLHYGAPLEPSGASTPGSEWNAGRRQSDPMDQWNSGGSSHSGGWTAGPWGGDGVMYGDPEHDMNLAALPSTSFGSGGDDMGDDDLQFKKGKHRKSKSYANISDFERGRRRESGRKSKDVDAAMFFFHGQQSDPAGRDSLRQSRGYSNENGPRRDSRNPATLPNRSFHHSIDPDEHIPLDTEPHATRSPVRDSMGPEDEELFAGPSLALYSFEPENANELRLVEGQEIMVSYRHGQGWLVASDPRTDEQGLVPEAYVRLIADMPNYDPETGQFVDIEEIEDSEVQHDSEMNNEDGNAGSSGDELPGEGFQIFNMRKQGLVKSKNTEQTPNSNDNEDSTRPQLGESGQPVEVTGPSEFNRNFNMDEALEEIRAVEAAQNANPAQSANTAQNANTTAQNVNATQNANQNPSTEQYGRSVYDDNGVMPLEADDSIPDLPDEPGSEDEDPNPMRRMEAKRLKRIARRGGKD